MLRHPAEWPARIHGDHQISPYWSRVEHWRAGSSREGGEGRCGEKFHTVSSKSPAGDRAGLRRTACAGAPYVFAIRAAAPMGRRPCAGKGRRLDKGRRLFTAVAPPVGVRGALGDHVLTMARWRT